MSQEIKVVLATEMKAAGIQATEQQVEKLAGKFKEMNRNTEKETNKTLNTLGKMPGYIGKIQSVLTGMAGKVALAFGVVGVALGALIKAGTYIWDKVIKPLKTMAELGKKITFTSAIKEIFGVTNATKEAEKAAKELKKAQEDAVKKAYEGWSKVFDRMKDGWDETNRASKEAVKGIEAATRAYLEMQAAQGRVTSANDSGVVLGLERGKFDEMAAAAKPEEAARIGARYDILIAEEKAKQEIAAFDEKAKQEAAELVASEQTLEELTKNRAAIEEQLVEAMQQEAKAGKGQTGDNIAKAQEKAAELVAKKKIELEEAANAELSKREEIAARKLAMTALEQERDNIRDKTSLEIAEKRKAEKDLIKEQADEKRKAEEKFKEEVEERERKWREEGEKQTREAQKKLAEERIKDLREEVRRRESLEREAQNRLSTAQSNLSSAWRTYRDKDAMKAEIQEYRDQKKAEQRYERDFKAMESRNPNWRTAEFGTLSARDEAVKRVALAREEEQAAKDAMIETAANTKDLAKKLDDLLQMKGQ